MRRPVFNFVVRLVGATPCVARFSILHSASYKGRCHASPGFQFCIPPRTRGDAMHAQPSALRNHVCKAVFQKHGHGPVIDQLDLHVGAEDSCFYLFHTEALKLFHKVQV